MHPIELFKKLLESKQEISEHEFKSTLELFDKPMQQKYHSVREQGLSSIQLSEDEKKSVESFLAENHYPLQYFDFQTYGELLFLTRLACQYERNHAEALNALKLTLMFGSTKQSLAYLVKFIDLKPRNQPIHDACLFALPGCNLDFGLWREFAIKFMPDEKFVAIIAHAENIQKYVDNHRSAFEKDIWNKLIENHKQQLASKRIPEDLSEEKYVAEKMGNAKTLAKINSKVSQLLYNQNKSKEEQVKITQEVNKEFENKFIKEFKKKSLECKQFSESEKQLNLLLNSPPDLISKSQNNTGVLKILRTNFETSIKKIYSKETDLDTLLTYADSISYARSSENLAISKLFHSLGVPEQSFNQYLDLKPCDDQKQIPDIFIDGEQIGYPNFYIKKLSPFDPKAAVLGYFTSCCQSIGDAGEEPAIYGITHPNAGFYVLCEQKGTAPANNDAILSQCMVWRGVQGNIVFDSIESQVNFRNSHLELIIQFFTYLAHHLVMQYNIPFVLTGIDGETPEALGHGNAYRDLPQQYQGYRDSKIQRVIASRIIPISQEWLQKTTNVPEKLIKAFAIQPGNISVNDKVIENTCVFWAVNQSRKNIGFNISKTVVIELMLQANRHLTQEQLNLRLDQYLEYLELAYKDYHRKEQIQELISYANSGFEANIFCPDRSYYDDNQYHDEPLLIQTVKHIYPREENKDLALCLMQKGASVFIRDKQGKPLSHWIVEQRDLTLLKYAIEEKNISINDKDRDGFTLLNKAIRRDAIDIARYLISKGADMEMISSPKAMYDSEYSSSKILTDENNLDLLKHIVKHIQNINEEHLLFRELTYLQIAIKGGNFKAVKFLIEECGANVNTNVSRNDSWIFETLSDSQFFNYLVDKGMRFVNPNAIAVSIAVRSGNIEMLNSYVKHISDKSELLREAFEHNKAEVIRYLIKNKLVDKKAKVRLEAHILSRSVFSKKANLETYQSISVLGFSKETWQSEFDASLVYYCDLKKLKYFVENLQVDINRKCIPKDDCPEGRWYEAYSPLAIAAHYQTDEVVKYLIEMKANHDKNELDICFGEAIHGNKLETAKYFKTLNNTINVNATNPHDSENRPPLYWAINNRNIDAINYLLELKADINARIGYDHSLLHYAVRELPSVKVIETLLQHPHIDLSITNEGGLTAEQLAEQRGDKDIAKLIQKAKQLRLAVKPREESPLQSASLFTDRPHITGKAQISAGVPDPEFPGAIKYQITFSR